MSNKSSKPNKPNKSVNNVKDAEIAEGHKVGKGIKDIWIANSSHQPFMLPIRLGHGNLQNVSIPPFSQMEILQCDSSFINQIAIYMDNHSDGQSSTPITFGERPLKGKHFKNIMMSAAEERIHRANRELANLSNTTGDKERKVTSVGVDSVVGDDDPTLGAIDSINPKDLEVR